MMFSKCRRLFWYLIIFCMMLFTYLQIQRWNERLESEEKTRQNDYKQYKKILIWTDYFQRKNVWKTVFQRHFSRECEETRCEFTLDKNKHNEADAVLFEGNSLELAKYRRNQERFIYPLGRKPHHIYIFFSTEPPTRFEDVKLENYKNFFNWTMTYRRDSDVILPFGLIKKRKTSKRIKYINEAELNRKNISIWLNTHNCDSKPRIDFIKTLQRYIAIDNFGKCFNRKCGEVSIVDESVRELGSDDCEKTFSNYAFFMALENSMCKDYVTEKLYRSLKLGIIPVTLGAVDYSDFAPPHSYIDARNFQTEADLATYLTKVANNVSLYNEYLKWHEEYEIDVGTPYKPLICELCKKLHSPLIKIKKVYKDIKEWHITGGNCSKLLIRNVS